MTARNTTARRATQRRRQALSQARRWSTLLRELCRVGGDGLTVRQLIDLCGSSKPTLYRDLAALSEQWPLTNVGTHPMRARWAMRLAWLSTTRGARRIGGG